MMRIRVKNKVVQLVVILIILAIAISVPYIISSRYWVGMVEEFLIFGLFAMSLDLLVGYCGLMSFGHAMFFGMAAYSVGILTINLHYGMLGSMILSLLITVFLAVVVASVVSHLKGLSFMMVTLAIAQVFWGLSMQWVSVTGGDNGIAGIAKLAVWGADQSTSAFYYFVLLFVVICGGILYFIIESPLGLAMKGIKQSESRMRVLGYNVWLYKFSILVISALFAGIAGVIWAQYVGFVGPSDLSIGTSAEAILMVLTGGAGTLFGPALGSLIIVFVRDMVSTYTQRWSLVMGLIYIVVVLFLPGGVLGSMKRALTRLQVFNNKNAD